MTTTTPCERMICELAASYDVQGALIVSFTRAGSARYTHHHGFVALNNPFDCVSLKLPEFKYGDK